MEEIYEKEKDLKQLFDVASSLFEKS